MIDKRLQQARQMYAMGQRVGFRGGGMDMGNASNEAQSAAMGGGNNNGGNTGGNTGGGNDGPRGPAERGVTTRAVNPVAISPVDRSAVGQFSTYGRNVMNRNLQGPTLGQQIGTGIKNIGTGIGNYIKGGGLLGIAGRGLSSLLGGIFGPSVPSTGNVGPAGIKTDGTYGTVEDAIRASRRNEPPREGGDGQGIMAMYNPYILPVEGEEVPVSQEEEDFIQRFRVANEFRQDKQGQLDPAILEMISKLYT